MIRNQKPGKPVRQRRRTIGWPEIAVGLGSFFVIGYSLDALLSLCSTDAVTTGVVKSQIAGIASIGGFVAAYALRTRKLKSFGFTGTTSKWLALGALGGGAWFVLRGFVTPALAEVFGLATDSQADLEGGAHGGSLALALTGFGLVIIGPIGEELLFRGVIQTGLMRYGAVVSTVGSAAVFAVVHGISVLTPIAFVFGLLAAELFRRSGSLWPAVAAHVVHNAPTPFLYLLL